MTDNYINKDAGIKKLKEEIEVLKKEAADREWGIRKTNEGIKMLYQELESKNRELQKLDQMKSDFVSTVSHELRTPMAIIKEAISQILEGLQGDVPESQQKLLKMALNNVNRLARIINDLLDISKIEAGKVEIEKADFDLVATVKEVCDSFEPHLLKKNLTIKPDICSDTFVVNADRDKIIQVFTNLIGNAVKFTHEGGITVKVEHQGDVVRCSVIDTGIGIAEEDLPKVFNKFQQFGRKDGPGDKGTGLGLAISRGIIELHQGDIWVESRLNEGTHFIFTLPQGNS